MAVARFFVLLLILATNATSSYCQDNFKLQLFDFTEDGREVSIRNPITVDSIGIQNDLPSFHPAMPKLFFTKKTEKGYEIQSFDFTTRERKTIATSAHRLLYPQVTQDEKHITCIVFSKGQNQLIRYPINGGDGVVLFEAPFIHNYLWIDDNSMLIITNQNPNELQLLTLRPKKLILVAKDVGSSLQKGNMEFAFVHKLSVATWSIKKINKQGSIYIAADVLPGAEHFALTPRGDIISLNENKLMGFTPSADWRDIELKAQEGTSLNGIRLNKDGNKLLVVVSNL